MVIADPGATHAAVDRPQEPKKPVPDRPRANPSGPEGQISTITPGHLDAHSPRISGTTTGRLDGTGVSGVKVDPIKLPSVLVDPQIDSRFASGFQPTYPADERRAGNQGRVVVRVLIGVDGRVKEVEKLLATSDSFFEVTRRRALEKWRFKPGTRDGVPVEAWRTMSVTFVLNDD